MKERPIIFSGEMVRAILSGRKTQTRRTVSVPKGAARVGMYRSDGDDHGELVAIDEDGDPMDLSVRCPYGGPGDRLWVKETFCGAFDGSLRNGIRYEADGAFRPTAQRAPGLLFNVQWNGPSAQVYKNKSPRYMPRWASRLTLEVVSVRVQRLHDISEEDARAEGVDWAAPHPYGEKWDDDDREDPREVGYAVGSFARDNFRRLWDSINGKDPVKRWEANPVVRAVEFRRVER